MSVVLESHEIEVRLRSIAYLIHKILFLFSYSSSVGLFKKKSIEKYIRYSSYLSFTIVHRVSSLIVVYGTLK